MTVPGWRLQANREGMSPGYISSRPRGSGVRIGERITNKKIWKSPAVAPLRGMLLMRTGVVPLLRKLKMATGFAAVRSVILRAVEFGTRAKPPVPLWGSRRSCLRGVIRTTTERSVFRLAPSGWSTDSRHRDRTRCPRHP